MIHLANRSASTIFGYDETELVGKSVEQLVPSEIRARHVDRRREYATAPVSRPMGTELRLFAEHRSGQRFPVEISLSPITIDGEVHTVATVRDVTQRQEAMSRLTLHKDRERIAHDLHDLVIQRLFAAGMSLQSVVNLIESPIARERVIAVTDELDTTVREVRAAIFRLGQHEAVRSLTSQVAELVNDRARHLGFTPDLSITGPINDVPDFVADQLMATLTEALSNVVRHADATDATIHISRSEGMISLRVRDNGKGIATVEKSMGGLSNIMWRAAELGGSCSVTPAEPTGTRLVWEVPV